ncbi:MAG: undecaprenyldiphospho-muramoylpentapeptide beta-N-acetylglucosaminyltransferase [Termitinemataceae bacterium]|nr:MAG: undecaprenyldiphospho-muramoylpentapeptide beta-N-acetylglucosaminyltransferase [Termitinemataceae bacterium]
MQQENNKNIEKTIAFAGGGTGGHIYPGLAVISSLQAAFPGNIRIIWIGSEAGMDRSIVEKFGIEFFGIKSGKLRRYFSLQNFFDIFKIAAGFFNAKKILKKQQVCFLFSKGGFASVPPVVAAAALKIPVWTHESDFSPGLATKINSHFAQKICIAYEKTAMYFSIKNRAKIMVCGNPVRPQFYSADAKIGREYILKIRPKFSDLPNDHLILLVLGGSQGAEEINNLITSSIDILCEHFVVVHQTGSKNAANAASAASDNYLPVPYIYDEMPHLLASVDLVLGRSGAGTVWECAAIGCPMVLVPLSGHGTRGDQVQNAEYFTQKGAALTFVHPSAETLCKALIDLAQDVQKLKCMQAASKEIGAMNGAKIIAKPLVEQLLDLKSHL